MDSEEIRRIIREINKITYVNAFVIWGEAALWFFGAAGYFSLWLQPTEAFHRVMCLAIFVSTMICSSLIVKKIEDLTIL